MGAVLYCGVPPAEGAREAGVRARSARTRRHPPTAFLRPPSTPRRTRSGALAEGPWTGSERSVDPGRMRTRPVRALNIPRDARRAPAAVPSKTSPKTSPPSKTRPAPVSRFLLPDVAPDPAHPSRLEQARNRRTCTASSRGRSRTSPRYPSASSGATCSRSGATNGTTRERTTRNAASAQIIQRPTMRATPRARSDASALTTRTSPPPPAPCSFAGTSWCTLRVATSTTTCRSSYASPTTTSSFPVSCPGWRPSRQPPHRSRGTFPRDPT